MDQSFSRYAIASILLVLLVPFEVLAILRSVSDKLPVFLAITIPAATPLGAIVLGHMARGQVRRSNYFRGGYGTGTAGMVCGYLLLAVFSFLYIRVSMSLSQDAVAVDESLALASLRDLSWSLNSYEKLHPDRGYPATLDDLASDVLLSEASRGTGFKIDFEPSREEKCGYKFTYVPSAKQNEAKRDSFELFADPIRNLGRTRRHFFLSKTGDFRYATNRPATAGDPEIASLF